IGKSNFLNWYIGEQKLFHLLNDDVNGSHVRFLNSIGPLKSAHNPFEISLAFQFAARFSQKSNGQESFFFGYLHSRNQISGVAACCQNNKNITALSICFDCARKHMIVTNIISDASQVTWFTKSNRG